METLINERRDNDDSGFLIREPGEMAVVWAGMGAGKGGWQKTVTPNGPQEQGTCAEVS